MRDPAVKRYHFLHAESAEGFAARRQTGVVCTIQKPERPLSGEYNAGVPRHLTSNHYTVLVRFKAPFLRDAA